MLNNLIVKPVVLTLVLIGYAKYTLTNYAITVPVVYVNKRSCLKIKGKRLALLIK